MSKRRSAEELGDPLATVHHLRAEPQDKTASRPLSAYLTLGDMPALSGILRLRGGQYAETSTAQIAKRFLTAGKHDDL